MLTLHLPFPISENQFPYQKTAFSIFCNNQRSKLGSPQEISLVCPKKSGRKWRASHFGIFASVVEASQEEKEEGRGRVGGKIPSTDDPLPAGLSEKLMPKHVAVIMDGNSRWARERGLPVAAGHEAGARALKELVKLSCKWGIRVLTVFAFSIDNWLRPKIEVNFLMKLFESVLREELDNLRREDIQFCMIGDSSKIPKSLQRMVIEAEEITKNNSRLKLVVAVSYSGQSDIAEACRKIANKIKDGELEPTDINESLIEQELETSWKVNAPSPDLLIRTSGELRLSNFLLWQLAYTELFFVGPYWPDFGESDYIEALISFQNRHRRFGKRSGKA